MIKWIFLTAEDLRELLWVKPGSGTADCALMWRDISYDGAPRRKLSRFCTQAPSHVLNELGSSQAQLSPHAATSCHNRKSNISILEWKTEMTICFYWGCNHPLCSPYDSMLKANEENLFYSSGFDQSLLRKIIIIQRAPLFKMKYSWVINVSYKGKKICAFSVPT